MAHVLPWILALLGGFLGGIAGKTIHIAISRRLDRRREKRFLRFVRVVLPENKSIESITVGPSDKQTIEDLERQLRDASKSL